MQPKIALFHLFQKLRLFSKCSNTIAPGAGRFSRNHEGNWGLTVGYVCYNIYELMNQNLNIKMCKWNNNSFTRILKFLPDKARNVNLEYLHTYSYSLQVTKNHFQCSDGAHITVTQRGRFSLPCPGMYTHTIKALSGVSWVSTDHKLTSERQYLGFLLYHQF